MVHLVNKSPFKFRNLDSCLRVAQKDDPILLMEDGVYGAMQGTAIEGLMKKALESHPVYVMQADVKARGLDKLIDGIQVCDYAALVDLVEEHVPYSWL